MRNGKMKVLIIETEEVLKQSLSLFLEQFKHYEVLLAGSKREGLHLFSQAAPFDLVIAGDRLPDGDGLDMLCHLTRENPRLISVLMTVQGDEALAQRASRAGISGYLVKPFDLKQLEAVLVKGRL